MNSLFGKRARVRIFGTSVMLLLSVASFSGQTGPSTYAFVVASGFLCEGSESGSCPAIAESKAGDRYEISGAGAFDLRNKSAQAAGTFTHKSTNGNVLETGVWIASDLLSFESYGIAPAALMHKNPPLGRLQIGPKRLGIGSRPMPAGGLAVVRISLLPTTGEGKTAILQLNCALGDVPRERSVEGVRLSFDGNDVEFAEVAGARVMFLARRIQPPKAPPTALLREGETNDTAHPR